MQVYCNFYENTDPTLLFFGLVYRPNPIEDPLPAYSTLDLIENTTLQLI